MTMTLTTSHQGDPSDVEHCPTCRALRDAARTAAQTWSRLQSMSSFAGRNTAEYSEAHRAKTASAKALTDARMAHLALARTGQLAR